MVNTLERSESAGLIASDRVEGTTVFNREGEKLGTVQKFMVEKRSGKAQCAILEFGGLFGLGSDHYPLPWDMLTYDVDKGGYVVNVDKDQLRDAPRYGADETPEYTDSYGKTVFGYYGVSYPWI